MPKKVKKGKIKTCPICYDKFRVSPYEDSYYWKRYCPGCRDHVRKMVDTGLRRY